MHVKSTVKLNKSVINRISSGSIKALEMTAEAIHSDLKQSQTMPFDTGELQNRQTFVDYEQSSKGSVSIVSSTPYARRLYYHPEYNFNTSENRKAGGKWFDPYLEGGKKEKFAKETFEQMLKQYGGV